jgi:branched-chain amino acid transport system ATP-binding protein
MTDSVAATAEEVLRVEGIGVSFGGLSVLQDLSFVVSKGEVIGLIGPNGAGKSTAINVISGFTKARSGRVLFHGDELRNASPARRARMGIARTFQNLELFGSMTVYENVLCACGTSFGLASRRSARDRTMDVLHTLGLKDHAHRSVAQLPYGTKKLVELARVFVSQPKLVLLDEPVAGLNREEKAEFAGLFVDLIRQHELTGILVEHDMPTVRSTCSRIVVLDAGRQIAEGDVSTVLADRAVVDAYLGPLALTSTTQEGGQ